MYLSNQIYSLHWKKVYSHEIFYEPSSFYRQLWSHFHRTTDDAIHARGLQTFATFLTPILGISKDAQNLIFCRIFRDNGIISLSRSFSYQSHVNWETLGIGSPPPLLAPFRCLHLSMLKYANKYNWNNNVDGTCARKRIAIIYSAIFAIVLWIYWKLDVERLWCLFACLWLGRSWWQHRQWALCIRVHRIVVVQG